MLCLLAHSLRFTTYNAIMHQSQHNRTKYTYTHQLKCIILCIYVCNKINSHVYCISALACRVRPHLSDLLYFLSLCTLTARAQMTLPLTTTMSRTAAPRIPCTIFDVSLLAVAKAVYRVGNETGHRVQMTCIHYMPSPLHTVVAEMEIGSPLTPSPMATDVM